MRSQSSPSTLEMTVRSSKDLEIPFAIAPGVVSQEVPFSSLPLGSETVISWRGLAVYGRQSGAPSGEWRLQTGNLGILSSLDLVENVEAVLDEVGGGRELSRFQHNGRAEQGSRRTSSPAFLGPLAPLSLGCLAGREGMPWADAPSAALEASACSDDMVRILASWLQLRKSRCLSPARRGGARGGWGRLARYLMRHCVYAHYRVSSYWPARN